MIFLINEFIRQSRELATATRGRELFEKASKVLQSVFDIDSGFFAYKKQFFLDENNGVKAYSPWGLEPHTNESLSQLILSEPRWQRLDLYVKTERWIDVEKSFSPWKEIWVSHQITNVGLWPIEIQNRIVGAIVLGRKKGDFAEDADAISLCAIQISLILDMLSTRRLAEHASQHDPLTDILNRRGFEDYMSKLQTDETSSTNLAIGVLDVDDFKFYNDNYGHKGGDSVLIDIADTLKKGIGKNGCCARFGGDEFVFIIKGFTDIQATMNEVKSWFSLKPYAVSIGCQALNPDNEDWGKAFSLADQSLYLNKAQRK